jgi:hypothetical protein
VVRFVSQRGTDPATERRRLRGSDDEEQDATGRLLEATFWVSAEAFFFGLPTLVWTTLFGDVAVTFVVAVALSTFCFVGGGSARGRSPPTGVTGTAGTTGDTETTGTTGAGHP